MADLKNELRWSHTRQQRWDACRRMYYLAHYAHWNGWDRRAPALARQCYTLTKMINLPMLGGDVVHRVIEKILSDHRAGHSRDCEAWIAEARRLLNESWKQSRERKWEHDPKRSANLFEHYYNLAIDAQETARVRDRVIACLTNFLACELWQMIRRADPQRWRCLEELEMLALGEHGLWIKIDFAFDDADGLTWLIDWKTGREKEEHRDQLLAYALHAHHTWHIPAERMRLVPVYLRQGTHEVIQITAADLIAAEQRVLAACRAMAEACDDPLLNTATMEKFAKTDDLRACARCFFQAVCFEESEWPCRSPFAQWVSPVSSVVTAPSSTTTS